MLGILLGVSSLVATQALVKGIEVGTRKFMEQVGGLEYVEVNNKEISTQMFEFWNLSPGRTMRDAVVIKESAPLVSHVSAEISHGALASAGGASERYRVQGVMPDVYVISRHELAAGRFVTDLDLQRGTKAAVIGDEIRKKFWPKLSVKEVLGQTLLLNGSPFTVVGVLERYERDSERLARERGAERRQFAGTSRSGRWDPFRSKNQSILIPLSTMFHEFKSGLFPNDALESVRIDNLRLRVADLGYFREALDQVRAALTLTHRGVDDFELETREEWFDRTEASLNATRLSGGLIALISLIVGGIGITNIMLASITERVREIGIRLAVGARGRDIFLQILIESVSISVIGGFLGILAGVVLIQILGVVAPASDNEPVLTAGAVGLSVFFAVVAGVVSGLYPALRASRLDPIQALRYE